jgi:hypothetical protein
MEDNTKISIQKDGNQWCVLWGRDLMESIAGFGDTVDEAVTDFALDALSCKCEVLADGIIRKENNQGGLMGYKLWIDDSEWSETIKFKASKYNGKKGKLLLLEEK